MQISEVRIKLIGKRNDRLKAFCSVTIDNDFVIRDLKVIDGAGGCFVAMPSRKITDRCPACGIKNYLRAKFCNECGKHLSDKLGGRGGERIKLYADIAHPVNSRCREMIQKEIIAAYNDEVDKSKQPGYVPSNISGFEDGYSYSSSGTASAQACEPAVQKAPLAEEREKTTEHSSEAGDTSFSEGIL